MKALALLVCLLLAGCKVHKEPIGGAVETRISEAGALAGPDDYIVERVIDYRRCFVLYHGVKAESISCTQ